MKTIIVFASVVLFLAGAALGHFQKELRAKNILSSIESLPPEYFENTESFSEVGQARTVLQSLAAQIISQLRTELLWPKVGTGESETDPKRRRLKISQSLEEAIEEFKGTDQEGVLLRELLGILRQEKNNDRWVDLYLSLLYRQPTHEQIGFLAREALTIAKSAGREEEVRRGFIHLASIPLNFENKAVLQNALTGIGLAISTSTSPPSSLELNEGQN